MLCKSDKPSIIIYYYTEPSPLCMYTGYPYVITLYCLRPYTIFSRVYTSFFLYEVGWPVLMRGVLTRVLVLGRMTLPELQWVECSYSYYMEYGTVLVFYSPVLQRWMSTWGIGVFSLWWAYCNASCNAHCTNATDIDIGHNYFMKHVIGLDRPQSYQRTLHTTLQHCWSSKA